MELSVRIEVDSSSQTRQSAALVGMAAQRLSRVIFLIFHRNWNIVKASSIKKSAKESTPTIRCLFPTQLLCRRSAVWIYQIGRDELFSAVSDRLQARRFATALMSSLLTAVSPSSQRNSEAGETDLCESPSHVSFKFIQSSRMPWLSLKACVWFNLCSEHFNR